MKIVVTIPAYNEEKTIGILINKINDVMKSNRYNYKILVVDDGSRDKTAVIAKNAKAIVCSHPKNYGLAETFRTEIEKALGLGGPSNVSPASTDAMLKILKIPCAPGCVAAVTTAINASF